MSYRIMVLRRAQKELEKLPSEAYGRAKEDIQKLADNPRPEGCSKLTGREGWRIRVGDYRVIYEVDDKGATVTILHVGHRRDGLPIEDCLAGHRAAVSTKLIPRTWGRGPRSAGCLKQADKPHCGYPGVA